jgi:alpha-amylase
VALNASLREAGITPVCDVVINHRTADEIGPEGVYNVYSDEVDHTGTAVHWGRHMITCNDPEFHGSGSPVSLFLIFVWAIRLTCFFPRGLG